MSRFCVRRMLCLALAVLACALPALCVAAAEATEGASQSGGGWQVQFWKSKGRTMALDALGGLWVITTRSVERVTCEEAVSLMSCSNLTALFATQEGSLFAARPSGDFRLAPEFKATALAASDFDNDSTGRDSARYQNEKDLKEFNCLFYAVNEAGELYAWGNRRFGLVGNGKTGDYRACWTRVELPPVSQISTSGRHTGVVTQTGEVYLWGENAGGQLGLRGDVVYVPHLAKELPKAARVFCRNRYTLVIAQDGTLWGSGMLSGDKTLVPGKSTWTHITDAMDTPNHIAVAEGRFEQVKLPGRVVDVCGDDTNVLAVLEDGSLYLWGRDFKKKPTKQKLGNVRTVAADEGCYIAVTADGQVYGLGDARPLGLLTINGDAVTVKNWTHNGLNLLTGEYAPPGQASGKGAQSVSSGGSQPQEPIAMVLPLPAATPAPAQRPHENRIFPKSAAERAFSEKLSESVAVTFTAATPGYDYYVQVRSTGDDVVEGTVWLNRGDGGKATLELPCGNYYLQLSAGSDKWWYGEGGLFGDAGVYQTGQSFSLNKGDRNVNISLIITTEAVPGEALTPEDF